MVEKKKNEGRNELFKRLTQLFRGGPSIKRKVRAFRTPAASTATEVFKKSYSQVYSNALNAYGQYDRMCIDMDTEHVAVPGAVGFKSIRQLAAEYPNGEKFAVYAYDHNAGHVVPAWAHHPRSSGFRDTVKVTFDDESTLICTPDHPCMMRDGSYRDARELKSGDSMMPFYRKQFNGKAEDGKSFKGYRNVYTCGSMEGSWHNWISEHKLIAEWSQDRKLQKGTEHVHHVDHDPTNNDPSNLVFVNAKDHLSEHGKQGAKVWETHREKMLAGIKSAWDNDTGMRRDAVSNVNRRLDVREKRRKHWALNNPMHKEEIIQKARESRIETYKTRSQEQREEHSNNIKLAHAEGRLVVSENFSKYWENRRRSEFAASLTIEKIIEEGRKLQKPHMDTLAESLGVSGGTLGRYIVANGYTGWKEFKATYLKNHKVVSVEPHHAIEVGDLTVDGYENFATDSIFVHNSRYADFSEMEYTPEIASALDIYSEEATSVDDRSVVLHVYSNNPKIQSLLSELFHDIINVEYNLTPWTRNLVKYGDFFLFIDVHPETGVINVFPMPINEVERDEGWDPQDPLAVRYRWVTQGNQILESWQVAHFRLAGNDSFLPYGSSVLESARRIWRQLILIEDAMLVYRVVRSPERRVFYIDVGAVPTEEIPNYMEAAQTKLKRSPVIDKSTGRIDLRYNPLSVDEDYFIPVRGDASGTRIDSLAGGQHVSDIADVEYIQKKLFAAIKVPRAYLGYDENLSSKATLAQEDIRFSRSISRIQRVLISELQKIAIIHLYAYGFEGEDLSDFSLFLSNPSTVAQQQKLELWRTKFEIAGSVPEGLTDRDFLRKEIFQLTDEQIDEIREGRKRDRLEDMELEATELENDSSGGPGAGGGGMGGGLGGLPGSGGGDELGMDDLGSDSPGGSPGAEGLGGGSEDAGGSESESSDDGEKEDLFAGDAQIGKELLTGIDLEDDDEIPEADASSIGKSLADLSSANSSGRKKAPSKSTPLSKYLYDRGRLRTHGASKTHMPNFNDIVSFDADPHEDRFFNANPFSESKGLQRLLSKEIFGVTKTGTLSAETRSMLNSLRRRLDSLGKKRVNAIKVITESNEFDNISEIDNDLQDILEGTSSDDIELIDEKSESEYEDDR